MVFSCRCHSTTGGITSLTLLPFELWAPDTYTLAICILVCFYAKIRIRKSTALMRKLKYWVSWAPPANLMQAALWSHTPIARWPRYEPCECTSYLPYRYVTYFKIFSRKYALTTVLGLKTKICFMVLCRGCRQQQLDSMVDGGICNSVAASILQRVSKSSQRTSNVKPFLGEHAPRLPYSYCEFLSVPHSKWCWV